MWPWRGRTSRRITATDAARRRALTLQIGYSMVADMTTVLRRSLVMLVITCMLFTGASLVVRAGSAAAAPGQDDDWVGRANWWRSLGGFVDGSELPPLTGSANATVGSRNQTEYLAAIRAAGSSYCGHGADPARPRPAGNYNHNVLFCGPDSLSSAVDGWLKTPLHGDGFLDPHTSAVGGWIADDISAAGFVDGFAAHVAAVWPRPNGRMPVTEWLGGEIPNPAAICPPDAGVKNGQPVFVFPRDAAGARTWEVLASSITDGAGQSVQHCVLTSACVFGKGSCTSAYAGGGFYLFPKRPYADASTYTVSVLQRPLDTNGAAIAGDETLRWSFSTPGGTRPAGGLRGMAPRRLVDTRETGARVSPGSPLRLALGGLSADATAVALNVTAVGGSTPGFLAVVPCGAAGGVSSVNFQAGEIVAGSVIVGLGPSATVCVSSNTSVDVVVDLNASVAPSIPDSYRAVTPARLIDTRLTGQRLAAGATVEVQVAGRGGVPSDAVTATVNLAAVDPGVGGFLTAYPCGTQRPIVSNLNVVAGVTRANLVNVVLGGGKVCVYSQVPTDVLLDVSGSHGAGAGLRFQPIDPSRVYDSRLSGGRLIAGQSRWVFVGGEIGVPSAVAAAQVNLTTVDGAAPGFLTVYANGFLPAVSNVNFPRSSIVPNAATVALAAQGSLLAYVNADTHLLIDVTGIWI